MLLSLTEKHSQFSHVIIVGVILYNYLKGKLLLFVNTCVLNYRTTYTLNPRKTRQVLMRAVLVILNLGYNSPKYTVYLVGKNKNVYDQKWDLISGKMMRRLLLGWISHSFSECSLNYVLGRGNEPTRQSDSRSQKLMGMDEQVLQG